ncbi:MAG: ribonuclease HII [Pseudomonadota bacterium]
MSAGLPLIAASRDGWVAGVDEAGRGPLAGPVVASAVILDPERVPRGLNDSKQLSASRRSALATEIREVAVAFAVVSFSASEIDQRNILACTMSAMAQAVAELEAVPVEVRVDGNRLPPACERIESEWIAIVGGDGLDAGIAAASILAKTTRDALMIEYDELWPQYGFARHKGYGTKQHMTALETYGPCEIHRASFAPVKRALRTQDGADGR